MQDDATEKRYRSTAHVSQLKLWTPAMNDEKQDAGPRKEDTGPGEEDTGHG